jgi:HptB-dependent secretion and biofilm anti anti-sigma factor
MPEKIYGYPHITIKRCPCVNNQRQPAQPMNINLQINGNTATISVSGKFVFEVHREFRKAYRAALESSTVHHLDIDLSNAVSLDTAALGMLLILKERAKEAEKKLRLINCKGVALQTLTTGNFNKLFTITTT